MCVSRNCEGMESREKKMLEPNDEEDEEEDGDPKPEDAEPSLDSLGRPVSGSRRVQGANIGLGQRIINIVFLCTYNVSIDH